jgi:murein DD-endopeptidase MepM/ murein hydrolase activator NlpD
MSVTLPPLESSSETDTRSLQRAAKASRGGIGYYSVHLGLLVVALAVWSVTRLDLNWGGLPIELPSVQAQAVITPTPALQDEGLAVPAVEPTVIPDLAMRPDAIPHTYEPNLPTHNFAKHVVEKGDTPNKVAETYGLEPATLLWGNPELSDKAQLLQVGITLTILPQDGVLHTVEVTDTVESIAAFYGVEPQVIIDYTDNNLAGWPHRPVPGTQIFIPGGEKPFLVWSYTPNSARGQLTSAGAFYEGQIIYAGIGRFVWPTGSWRITQYYWWAHRAIDIGAVVETPVYASDGGTVIYSGWSAIGYGNLIVLDHGNGFQTYYAHLNSIWVANGQFVPQGTPIAGVGSTGNSSGPHLHFEIRYNGVLLNPLDYLWR